MDHVRPKIKITACVLLLGENSTLTMIAELNYEKGYFKHGKQIINVSADNKRRKEFSIACRGDGEDEWEEFSIEFNDYPSGLRAIAIMIKSCCIDENARVFGYTAIAHVKMEVLMPDSVELKEFKKDEEDIEQRKYCEICERYYSQNLKILKQNHKCFPVNKSQRSDI